MRPGTTWGLLLLAVTVGAFTLAIVLYGRFGFGTLIDIGSGDVSTHVDFDIFRHSALKWLEGANPFRDTGGTDISNNPPLFTVLFAPFVALLEPIAAYRCWMICMWVTQLAALAWASAELRMSAGVAVLATGALLVSAPLLGTLVLGQMYPLLTLGLVAAWAWERNDSPVASGVALGLVVSLKPSLASVLLWPLVRRRWGTLAAALGSGAVATVVGVAAVGVGPTLDWLTVLRTKTLDGSWDSASLPGLAAITLRPNRFAEALAAPPYVLTAALLLGLALLTLTAWRARHGTDAALWALAAASLLASPVTWHSYLPILAPGVLLLFARGWSSAPLLVALALVPPSWSELWEGRGTVAATLALGLYSYILLAHWLAFFAASGEKEDPGR